jgi:hypothetical protein
MAPGWRKPLRNKIVLLMCAKLVLLTLLWALFFAPWQRIAADSNATGRRLGVDNLRAPNEPGGAPTANPLIRRSQRD